MILYICGDYMKRIPFLLLMLPLLVNAKVLEHYIDTEIEIAGGLRVKELIIVEGENSFERKINIKNIKENNKYKSIENLGLYNGETLENLKISSFKATDKLNIDTVDNHFKKFYKEGKNKDNYVKDDFDLGYTIKITPKTNYKKTAYYLEYLISNVIVMHEDIAELNFSFKNLNYKANTTFRLIIPYPTDDDKYMFWFKGPRNTKLNELVDSNEEKLGFQAEIENLNSDLTTRMTLPKEQVGIHMYLTKTEIDAFDLINEYENNERPKDNKLLIKIIIAYTIIFGSISLLIYILHKKGIIRWFQKY